MLQGGKPSGSCLLLSPRLALPRGVSVLWFSVNTCRLHGTMNHTLVQEHSLGYKCHLKFSMIF